jgi:hypothetical protein
LLLPWHLLPLILPLIAFLAAFTLDPVAVTRLVWASVNGSFGKPTQIAGSALLLGVVAAAAWAFRPLPTAVPTSVPTGAAGRQKAAPRKAKRTTSPKDVAPAGAEPAEPANPPKRRTRNRRAPEAAATQEAVAIQKA